MNGSGCTAEVFNASLWYVLGWHSILHGAGPIIASHVIYLLVKGLHIVADIQNHFNR